MTDPAVSFWKAQSAAAARPDAATLDARARLLERRVWQRDAIEYAACAGAIALFGWFGWAEADALFRFACGVLIAGTLLVSRNLWVRRVEPRADEMGMAGLAYYRAQLVRQRDALASVWRWYLAPFAPGLALFLIAVWRLVAAEKDVAAANLGILLAGVPIVLVFIGIHWLNRAAARRLNGEIAALDRELDPNDERE